MLRTLGACAIAAVVLTGCAKRLASAHPARCALMVEGVHLRCGTVAYATIETYFCRRPAAQDGGTSPFGSSCFGLAVLYADGERAWLYRGTNWDRALAEGKYVATTDTEGKLGGAYAIQVGRDGVVRFQLPLTVGTLEYAVEEGVLRRSQ